MKKIIAIFFVIIASTSLMAQDVNPSKLEYRNMQLELANSKLRLKVDSLEDVITELEAKLIVFSSFQDMLDSLENVNPQQSMYQEDGTFYVTEDRALEIIKDDYEFYNRNYKYRGVKLRRKGPAEFWVSLEECHKKMLEFDSWSARVKTLTVNEDGTFHFN